MDPRCAALLNNIGQAYERRSRDFAGEPALRDMKRAEACFNRALGIYMTARDREQVKKTLKRIDHVTKLQSESKSGKVMFSSNSNQYNMSCVTSETWEDSFESDSSDFEEYYQKKMNGLCGWNVCLIAKKTPE